MDECQRLFSHAAVSCAGNLLTDFVERVPISSSVRDARSNKCLLTNHHNVSWCGVRSTNDLIGVTPYEFWIEDIAHRRKHLNLESAVILSEESYLKNIQELEDQMLLSKSPVSIHHVLLRFDGLIRFEDLIKIPVLSHTGKVISFLTIYNNLNHRLPLPKLFQLYQQFYSKKKSILNTLRHLRLETYFNSSDLPTCMEMQVLFAMCNDSRCKSVARQLGCSVTTASNHISHIQEKILAPFTIHNVLIKLREIPAEHV